jgi:hypothetical protein
VDGNTDIGGMGLGRMREGVVFRYFDGVWDLGWEV